MIEIRKENQADYEAVRMVHDLAFGQHTEAMIVDKIRYACDRILSLVAQKDGKIIGHILFSPVLVRNEEKKITGMGLGPMAVSPEFQKQGIGTLLINEGIELLKNSEYRFIVVLGHAEYYPRFGFEIASKYGLVPQWDGIPDEAFMVLFLDESATKNLAGIAFYRDEFNEES